MTTYDRLVTIQRPVLGASGDPTSTNWEVVAGNLFAARLDRTAVERILGSLGDLGFHSVAWLIRWRSDVTSAMRIRESPGGELYQVTGVQEGKGRRRELMILTERIGQDSEPTGEVVPGWLEEARVRAFSSAFSSGFWT